MGALRMRKLTVLVTALVAVLLPTMSRAQGTPLAFTHVTVIDVEGGRAVPGQTVVVHNGHITAVSEQPAPPGAHVIDAGGKYLIPGLWDMHVHAALPGVDAQFFPLLLANGVTGVREMFSRMDWL